MRKKSGFTIVEQAVMLVSEFEKVVRKLEQRVTLRGQEVINLKISDFDFERKTIHIRQSKYKKDRIVPLAESMAVGLKKYLKAENPHIWLFNGKEPDGRMVTIRELPRIRSPAGDTFKNFSNSFNVLVAQILNCVA
jgi:integrase